jgi:hypothetical protein
MATLKRQIYRRVRGSFAQDEDWWRLCYDTQAREFFVEHEWSHVDPFRVDNPFDVGTRVISVDSYRGPHARRLAAMQAKLLAVADQQATAAQVSTRAEP